MLNVGRQIINITVDYSTRYVILLLKVMNFLFGIADGVVTNGRSYLMKPLDEIEDNEIDREINERRMLLNQVDSPAMLKDEIRTLITRKTTRRQQNVDTER